MIERCERRENDRDGREERNVRKMGERSGRDVREEIYVRGVRQRCKREDSKAGSGSSQEVAHVKRGSENDLQEAEVVVDFSPAHPRPMEIPCVILAA
ncbi:hypothetical protein TNCV_3659281 [Trichonephila clavipes]|nr:hypothetical protein TNCV_3659281 [Trichonephila clavipes]